MRDIRWNTVMLAEFRSLACLTADENEVLKDWARGDVDITATATRLNMGTRKVDSLRESIRRKYDDVQIYTPLLPPRQT